MAAASPAPTNQPTASATSLGEPNVIFRVRTPKGNRLEPGQLTARRGDVARLIYTNLAGIPHNWNLQAGTSLTDPKIANTITVSGSKPVSVVFRVPKKPGRYLYYCNIAGHEMDGFLTVE